MKVLYLEPRNKEAKNLTTLATHAEAFSLRFMYIVEPLYIKALKIAERSLGVNHPNTITIRKNLDICQNNS